MYNKNNHAFLICESAFCDIDRVINEVMISFVCNHNYNNKCTYCQKIISNNYYDCIKLNSNYDIISKETILEIINIFSKAANEAAGYKFYIIKYIENINFNCLNSLLKFLENPASKTIAIFTTKNENAVFATIKSRCQVFRIPTDHEKLTNFLNVKKIVHQELYKNIFFSYDEIINFEKNDKQHFILDFIINFHNHINSYTLIFEDLNTFNKLSYYEINLILQGLVFVLDKKQRYNILNIINDLYYKPNKNLIFHKIIDLA